MTNIKYKRPSWDEYYFEIMHAVAKRATCDRGRSGCVIQKDNHILATGYVGAPSGLPSCDEVGHFIQEVIGSDDTIEERCIRTVHAEQNAICHAAKLGIAIDGATLYCTMTPCRTCALLIINSGIKQVICEKHYHNSTQEQNSALMFAQCNVSISWLSDEVEVYE